MSFLVLLGTVLSLSPAFAQTIVFDEGLEDDWRFCVTPHLFLPVKLRLRATALKH